VLFGTTVLKSLSIKCTEDLPAVNLWTSYFCGDHNKRKVFSLTFEFCFVFIDLVMVSAEDKATNIVDENGLCMDKKRTMKIKLANLRHELEKLCERFRNTDDRECN